MNTVPRHEMATVPRASNPGVRRRRPAHSRRLVWPLAASAPVANRMKDMAQALASLMQAECAHAALVACRQARLDPAFQLPMRVNAALTAQRTACCIAPARQSRHAGISWGCRKGQASTAHPAQAGCMPNDSQSLSIGHFPPVFIGLQANTDAIRHKSVRRPKWPCKAEQGLPGAALALASRHHFFKGIGVACGTGTAVTLFCGEPSITRSA